MPRKQFTAAEIKQRSKDYIALKKAGVLPSKSPSGKTVRINSSNTNPTFKIAGRRGSFTLSEAIKKFKPTLTGHAEIVAVSPERAKEYKKVGRAVIGDKVQIPRQPGNRVTVVNDRVEIIDDRTGVVVVELPVQYHNLAQYLKDISENSREINRMKRANESFAFSLKGNYSYNSFGTIQQMVDELLGYDSVMELLNPRKAREAREFYDILAIVKGPRAEIFALTEAPRDVKRRRTPSKSKAQQRSTWPEWRKAEYRKKHREQEKARRAKNKGK